MPVNLPAQAIAACVIYGELLTTGEPYEIPVSFLVFSTFFPPLKVLRNGPHGLLFYSEVFVDVLFTPMCP